MHKKNLFIVNSPYHLLTVFILAKSLFKEDENYLALVGVTRFERWQESAVMRYMFSKEAGYKDIFHLIHWLSAKESKESFFKQADYVKKNITPLGIDEVFLAYDVSPQNQLLVSAVGKDSFYRYDEGLDSYYPPKTRNATHSFFHKMKIVFLQKLLGFRGGVTFHTADVGGNPSGLGDYLYKPALLKRSSPKAFEIDAVMINAAVKNLKEKNLVKPQFEKKCVLYLSQPIVELGKVRMEEEIKLIGSIVRCLGMGKQLIYKPHPKDNLSKIQKYQELFPEMQVFNSIEPVQLFFMVEENLQVVLAYNSTALMSPDKFACRNIEAVGLANFYSGKQPVMQEMIMKESGVAFPDTIENFKKIIFDLES